MLGSSTRQKGIILSKSDNPPLAEQRIADVSLAVYKYFMSGK